MIRYNNCKQGYSDTIELKHNMSRKVSWGYLQNSLGYRETLF